ncbi:MAG: PKD domain-containing protein [Bacteroidales bacterium]|nr:PKD domain-containing protein [Bacteroidales bacterium]
MKKLSFYLLSMLMFSLAFMSCSDDEDPEPKPIARFTATVDTFNPLLYVFTNDSENAETYSWDFGDASTASTETSPSYTYAEAGDYTVILTATGPGGETTSTKVITVSAFTLNQFLGGTDAEGKIWYQQFDKLIDMVNPSNPGEWWYGWNSLPTVAQRNAVRNQEYIFKADGSFEFKTNGFTVRPKGSGFTTPFLWDSGDEQVYADSESWDGQDGNDLSTWGNNANLTFTVGDAEKYSTCSNRITITGKGGHIGPMDTGTELVVDEPAESVFYEILRYGDGDDQPDTLVLYTPWAGNDLGPGATRPGLGVITLVSYKSADQKPADEEEEEGKPLEANDIYDTFDADGSMTWLMDDTGQGDILDESFDNPSTTGINASAKVAKYYKAGSYQYTNAQFGLDYRMNLATRNVFKMKVYYAAGSGGTKKVAMKLQNSLMGGTAWETETVVTQDITTEDAWEEITFDFSGVSTNTDYDQIIVQFGSGDAGAPAGTFYFDELDLQ